MERVPPLVKTNVPYLVKDTNTGALINTNKAKLEAIKARKATIDRIDQLEIEVTTLTVELRQQNNTLDKISSLLQVMVDRNN